MKITRDGFHTKATDRTWSFVTTKMTNYFNQKNRKKNNDDRKNERKKNEKEWNKREKFIKRKEKKKKNYIRTLYNNNVIGRSK